MWKIRKVKSLKEIPVLVDMYLLLNDESFLPASRNKSIEKLSQHLFNRENFIRVLEHDDKVVAWVYAKEVDVDHYNSKALQQCYYSSSLKGIMAVKAVKLLHEELIQEAVKRKVGVVISIGSHLDLDNVFTRILEKSGWERRNFLAIYKTKYFKN